MSNNKMLIDATHPEETRVVVLRNGRVEEFDFESAARKLLRGNIYLAKVTRVEPSLQAAFVDYGGNRHGFLAFNEIHPDYYQIPVADRIALIEEEAAQEAAEEAAIEARAQARADRDAHRQAERQARGEDPQGSGDGDPLDAPDADDTDDDDDEENDHETIAEASYSGEDTLSEPVSQASDDAGASETQRTHSDTTGDADDYSAGAESTGDGAGGVQEVAAAAEPEPEQVGEAEDAMEEVPYRPRRSRRSYKIQEVIKRRQIILVQVVKEERGNKGAALTTYLSLAGRYTVLMPNTARGGGISRKITNPADRKRLKAIAQDLEVPEGMGLIIRTAGAARTKQEIKRDFEYLLRLWESVRELTLSSTAPSLVYEEGDLIKRSIRDLYNKDVEEIQVAGDAAHREAKDFMRMLMPSHVKNVIDYKDPEPLFTRFGIERQLNAMFSPYVTLRSGGYMVINQTEALVTIDINSGKSTREFSIEETAVQTNLEAADEIARQLKLRDLAGLIVIDFIDMEEKRNNRAVERRLKDALRFDRARIQVGRISHFGLLEMSRQRLRTGVLEGSTSQCPHCQGTGIIRSTESVALAVLRGLEDAVTAGARTALIAHTTPTVALYILNNKRTFINDMELRLGMPVMVQGSDKLQGANYTIERGAGPAVPQRRPERAAVNMDWGFEGEGEEGAEPISDAPFETETGTEEHGGEGRHRHHQHSDDENGNGGRRRRRRRGRRGSERGSERGGDRGDSGQRFGQREGGGGRGGRDRTASFSEDSEGSGPSGGPIEIADDDAYDEAPETIGGEDRETDAPREARRNRDDNGGSDGGNGDKRGRRRRRGRRGGRRARNGEPRFSGENNATDGQQNPADSGENDGWQQGDDDTPSAPGLGAQPAVDIKPKPYRAPRTREPRIEPPRPEPIAVQTSTPVREEADEMPAPRRTRGEPVSGEPKLERVVVTPGQPGDNASGDAPSAPARKGWWQRR